jgi:hypothetical protein
MANKRQAKSAHRARLEQERQQRAARRKRQTLIAAAIAVVGLAVVLTVALTGSKKGPVLSRVSGGPSVDPNSLPGILTDPPPWPNNSADVADRISADQLPPLGAEGEALHIHQHIDIFIRGQATAVPAEIGIVTSPSTVFAPIHTHDASGIVHVESPVVRDFSLGEFFDVWGVPFTSTCIGSLCNSGNERLQVFANGKVVTFDPRRLKLTEHEEIVVTFGTPDQIPRPYPISYNFPSGL